MSTRETARRSRFQSAADFPQDRLSPVQSTAGIYAEYQQAGPKGYYKGAETDLQAMLTYTNVLGIVSIPLGSVGGSVELKSADHPHFWPWLTEHTTKAGRLLKQDDGAAWDRVRFALERKGTLTEAEVLSLTSHRD